MEKTNSRNLEKEAYVKLRSTLEDGLLINLLGYTGVTVKDLDTKQLSKEVTLHLAMEYIELLLELSAYGKTGSCDKETKVISLGKDAQISEKDISLRET